MFELYLNDNKSNPKVTIYDISYDSNGYPLFLYYDYNTHQWIRKSAKYFYPVRSMKYD